MVGKSKPVSREDKWKMKLIKEQAWCIPCILNETPNRPHTEIHHTISGGRRTGDFYGNCIWHHRGIQQNGLSRQEMKALLGSSLALGSKEYAREWSQEPDLVRLQDYLLELWVEMGGWEQYNLPAEIGRKVRKRWQRLKKLQ
jgi:hypothetical protein